MTRREVGQAIYEIIRDAGGSWKDVERIFAVMGKLTPEPTSKPTVPPYDESMVQRTRKLDFTDEQRSAARSVLRDLGLI